MDRKKRERERDERDRGERERERERERECGRPRYREKGERLSRTEREGRWIERQIERERERERQRDRQTDRQTDRQRDSRQTDYLLCYVHVKPRECEKNSMHNGRPTNAELFSRFERFHRTAANRCIYL